MTDFMRVEKCLVNFDQVLYLKDGDDLDGKSCVTIHYSSGGMQRFYGEVADNLRVFMDQHMHVGRDIFDVSEPITLSDNM